MKKKTFLLAFATAVSLSFSAQKYDKIPLDRLVQPYNSAYATTVNANLPTTKWEDFADTSWYNSTDTEFVINTAEQLAGLSQLVFSGNNMSEKTFKLGTDLDLGSHLWLPIGYDIQRPFSGNFDGNGKTIRNLYISKVGKDFAGLFGQFFQAEVKNLTIDGAIVSAMDTVGTLVGNLSTHSVIENCHVKNTKVTAVFDQIDNRGGYNAGGLVGGAITESKIINSSVQGEVNGYAQIGGLIGSPWDKVSISKSYFTGLINGQNLTGGLVGFSTFAFGPNREVEITDCFAKADVRGVFKVGGLYGFLQMGNVSNSYFAGKVTGVEHTGSFTGDFSFGNVSNSFYDSSLSSLVPIGNFDGPQNPQDITGLSTEDMKSEILLNALNKDAEKPVWKLDTNENDGYPSLIVEQLSTTIYHPKNEVKVYPTLVSDVIYIDAKENAHTYKIIDFSGRILKSGNTNHNALDVSSLPSGNYILQVETKQNISNHKFIKK